MNLSPVLKISLFTVLVIGMVSAAQAQTPGTYIVAPNTENTGETTGSTASSPNLLPLSTSGANSVATYYVFAGFTDTYNLYGGGLNPTTGGTNGTLTYATPTYTSSSFLASTPSSTSSVYISANNQAAWAENNMPAGTYNNTGDGVTIPITQLSTLDSEWIAVTPNQNNNTTISPQPGTPPGTYNYLQQSFVVGGVTNAAYDVNIAGNVFADDAATITIRSLTGGTINGSAVTSLTLDTPAAAYEGFGAAFSNYVTLQGGETYDLSFTVLNQDFGRGTSGNVSGLAVSNFDIQYVPEPSTYAAWLLAGVLAIAVVRRFKRNGDSSLAA